MQPWKGREAFFCDARLGSLLNMKDKPTAGDGSAIVNETWFEGFDRS